MAGYTFANFDATTIAYGAGGAGQPLLQADTAVTLQSGAGASYAGVASTKPAYGLIGTISGTHEIVKITGVSTDTLTIVRSQEGTSAPTSWPIGTAFTPIVTAGVMGGLLPNDGGLITTDGSGNLTAQGGNIFLGTSGLVRFQYDSGNNTLVYTVDRTNAAQSLAVQLYNGSSVVNAVSFGNDFGGAPLQFNYAGQITILGGVPTAGLYGAPLMYGATKAQSVTSTTQATIVTKTMPSGTDGWVKFGVNWRVGSGNTNNGVITVVFNWTDAFTGSATSANPTVYGGTTGINGVTQTKGTTYNGALYLAYAKAGTTVSITYQNTAAGTISDLVSGFIVLPG